MSGDGDEAAKEARDLAPWRAAYGGFFGHAPELRRADDGSSVLVFRREEDRFGLFRRMVGTLGMFAKKPRMLAHLRALGFDWDEDGVILTIPTPTSFGERAAILGLAKSGFMPEIVVLDALDIPSGAWLTHLMRAVVPLNVGTERLYARELRARRTARRERSMIHHLLCLPHDTTKHLLVFHLVPRSCLDDLGVRARAALGLGRSWLGGDVSLHLARVLGALPKGLLAPVPLLTFYENDLYDYCQRVWSVVDQPEDFAPTFARKSHYVQLVDVLSRRVAQVEEIGVPWREVPPRPYARFEVARAPRG
jgi:hypothetical protein